MSLWEEIRKALCHQILAGMSEEVHCQDIIRCPRQPLRQSGSQSCVQTAEETPVSSVKTDVTEDQHEVLTKCIDCKLKVLYNDNVKYVVARHVEAPYHLM